LGIVAGYGLDLDTLRNVFQMVAPRLAPAEI